MSPGTGRPWVERLSPWCLKRMLSSHDQLCSFPSQGEMARCWIGKSPQLWFQVVQNLPPEPIKFALDSALDTLPTNSNLHLWGKEQYGSCPLCSSPLSLLHVLNNCPIAMDLHQYSRRHDQVLLFWGNSSRAIYPLHFVVPSTFHHHKIHVSSPHYYHQYMPRCSLVVWSFLTKISIRWQAAGYDERSRCSKLSTLHWWGNSCNWGDPDCLQCSLTPESVCVSEWERVSERRNHIHTVMPYNYMYMHTHTLIKISQSTVVHTLYIGLGPLCLYIQKFQFALSLSVIIHFWQNRMITEVNMYVYLKFG